MCKIKEIKFAKKGITCAKSKQIVYAKTYK